MNASTARAAAFDLDVNAVAIVADETAQRQRRGKARHRGPKADALDGSAHADRSSQADGIGGDRRHWALDDESGRVPVKTARRRMRAKYRTIPKSASGRSVTAASVMCRRRIDGAKVASYIARDARAGPDPEHRGRRRGARAARARRRRSAGDRPARGRVASRRCASASTSARAARSWRARCWRSRASPGARAAGGAARRGDGELSRDLRVRERGAGGGGGGGAADSKRGGSLMCATCGCSTVHDHVDDHVTSRSRRRSRSRARQRSRGRSRSRSRSRSRCTATVASARISLEEAVLAQERCAGGGQSRVLRVMREIAAFNFTSAPGAGKTSLLVALIGALAERLPIRVIEGDQETARDAERIRAHRRSRVSRSTPGPAATWTPRC